MKMQFLFFDLILIYFIIDDGNCRKIVDLEEEYLASFGEAELDDENYEIIQFWYCNETENGRGLRIKRSDRNETWYIDEAPIIREKMPVWLVYNATRIVKADENIIGDAIKFYQQPELAMSVALQVDKYNHLYFTGSISKMKIVPLSQRAARSISQKKPHLFEKTLKPGTVDQANEFTISGYHVIYEPKREKPGEIILPAIGNSELFKESTKEENDTSYDRSKRSIPLTIYPEILAVLDYGETYTSIYELRFLHLLIYTINFWNSVNLRFKALSNPEVQLKLTGIVVNMHRKAIPIIHSGLIAKGLQVDNVLETMSFWLKTVITKSFDIAITQTNLPLCRRLEPYCTNKIMGISYWGGSCDLKDNLPLSGVIYDDMHYVGIRAGVHEIGHILGATNNEFENPGECPPTYGYIMDDYEQNLDHPFSWSRCSKRDISNHLRSSAADCYGNKSPRKDQGDLVELLTLPGSQLSLRQQCLDRSYGPPCNLSWDVCKALKCRFIIHCKDTGPALDGTLCPIGECRMGVCLPIVSNLTSNLQKQFSTNNLLESLHD